MPIRTALFGLLASALLACVCLPMNAQAQGAGAAKAQAMKKKPAASSTRPTMASTSREAKEKVCIQ